MKSLNCNRGRLMTITYKEMRARALGIQEDKNKRVNFLRESIAKLLSEYKKSLNLENEVWVDIFGKEHCYVKLMTYDSGELTQFCVDQLMSPVVEITFITVVNDEPTGGEEAKCVVRLQTDKNAEYLTVKVIGKNTKQFTVENCDFSNVCNAMKEETYINISTLDDYE